MSEQMEPGPDLDARVCQLFEPKPTVNWDEVRKFQAGTHYSALGWWEWFGNPPGDEWRPIRVSTDGNAMLRAIEAMRERGWLVTPKPLIDGYCAIVFPSDWSSSRHVQQELGDTLPHAVALAIYNALKERNA